MIPRLTGMLSILCEGASVGGAPWVSLSAVTAEGNGFSKGLKSSKGIIEILTVSILKGETQGCLLLEAIVVHTVTRRVGNVGAVGATRTFAMEARQSFAMNVRRPTPAGGGNTTSGASILKTKPGQK
jgi:hypothetical protein